MSKQNSTCKSFHRFTHDLGTPTHIFYRRSYIYQLKILLVGSKVETNLQGWGGIQSVSLREFRTHNGNLKYKLYIILPNLL